MTTEYFDDATQVRASDGSLERLVLRDGDPTEKSLLTLIEEHAGKAASAASTSADVPRTGRSSGLDRAEDADDRRGLDRTMMRLGGNGF